MVYDYVAAIVIGLICLLVFWIGRFRIIAPFGAAILALIIRVLSQSDPFEDSMWLAGVYFAGHLYLLGGVAGAIVGLGVGFVARVARRHAK